MAAEMNNGGAVDGRKVAALALALGVATALLYSRALTNDFVELDDIEYVTGNPYVLSGLSREGLAWVRRAVVVGNWHPMTMLSHMLDVELFGTKAWGHHLTSVLLHGVNTSLVFVVLWRLTGSVGPAAMAALLFGWHPQRVESVAWVAERKDVLSGLFGLLSLWAYASWVSSRSLLLYALAFALLALGLMSKPMLVTLPCVMLLLDYWPLGRLRGPTGEANTESVEGFDWTRPAGLVIEKLPFFAIAALFSLITYNTQQRIIQLSSPHLFKRIILAVTAYVDYVSQFLWPTGLAAYYPQPPGDVFDLGALLTSVGALAVATAAVAIMARMRPYLAMGWCWYVGMLVPVIGLVKVGEQARADRYMYLPSIGLGLMIAWGAREWAAGKSNRQRLAGAALGVWLVCLAAVTWRQIGTWQNSETMFRRVTQVTTRNALAMNGLGHALMEQGRFEESMECLDQAIEWAPVFGVALCSKAYLLHHLGRCEEAEAFYARMIEAGQDGATERINFGKLLMDLGKFREARAQYQEAQKMAPDRPEPVVGMAAATARLGQWAEAARLFGEVIKAQPDNPDALSGLADLYLKAGEGSLRRPAEALRLSQRSCELTENRDPELLGVYAAALAANGKFTAAAEAAGQGRRLAEGIEVQSPLILKKIETLRRQEEAYRAGREE